MGIKQLVYSARNKDFIFDLVHTVTRNIPNVQVVGCVYVSSLHQVAQSQLYFYLFLDGTWKNNLPSLSFSFSSSLLSHFWPIVPFYIP